MVRECEHQVSHWTHCSYVTVTFHPFKKWRPSHVPAKSKSEGLWKDWRNYHTVNEINGWLVDLWDSTWWFCVGPAHELHQFLQGKGVVSAAGLDATIHRLMSPEDVEKWAKRWNIIWMKPQGVEKWANKTSKFTKFCLPNFEVWLVESFHPQEKVLEQREGLHALPGARDLLSVSLCSWADPWDRILSVDDTHVVSNYGFYYIGH